MQITLAVATMKGSNPEKMSGSLHLVRFLGRLRPTVVAISFYAIGGAFMAMGQSSHAEDLRQERRSEALGSHEGRP
ncbi:hypothetical protein [Rhizobium hidalgonense]|uniref:hypothetical protein n=1 Tax=Rhizobium hidalgonense TaxID=1538159 RepID=UPI0010565170|nr:hypothetical protein [Rhizobium hidalgonense]